MFRHLYSFVIQINSYLYTKKIRKITKLKVPVISIGNISTGGSGKTPFTQTIVRKLLSLHQNPAVISRGYKRKSKGEIIVSDGNKIISNVQDAGDELYLHAIKNSTTVIANSNKIKSSQNATKKYLSNVIVLDDGFQHIKLFRDLDIVLIDKFTISQKYLLPKGRLREPFSSLKRADVICIEEGIDIQSMPYTLKPNQLLLITKTIIGKPYLLNQLLNKFKFNDKSEFILPINIIALSAIAHPNKFDKTLNLIQVAPTQHITYSDHHFYTPKDIIEIITICEKELSQAIITTEKDAVKLIEFVQDFEMKGIMVFVLPIEIIITENEDLFDNLLLELFTTKER
ncbi:MAG: tetraacyldisaccharide 4'-kinase [Bacteroidetes bacterium]|nr:tetraacyldisaccharide 4'-kinase [Bacteroidota bacterium]